MTVRERIITCRLIEKIEKKQNYSKSIGIVNVSKFKGRKEHSPAKKNK